MPTSLIALQILLILLPGFAASYFVQFLATRRPQSDLEKVIEALLFSFVIYFCYVWLNRGQLPFSMGIDPISKTDTILWDRVRFAELFGITFAVGLALVAYLRFDGNRIFRLFDTTNSGVLQKFHWLSLTERTTRSSIWNDIFESEADQDQVLQVELEDGRSVLGVLFYYSDLAEDCALYLTQAAWVSPDGAKDSIKIPGPGILLTKNSGIKSISLLDSPEASGLVQSDEPKA
jgi:hypothetical protein